jgi:hypothetical protein
MPVAFTRSVVRVTTCIAVVWMASRLYHRQLKRMTTSERRMLKINARLLRLKNEPRFACPWFRCQSFAWTIVGQLDPHHPNPEHECPDSHRHIPSATRSTETEVEYMRVITEWNRQLQSTHEANMCMVGSTALHVGDVVFMSSTESQPILGAVHWGIYAGHGQFLSKCGGRAPSTTSWEVLYQEYVKYGARPALWKINLKPKTLNAEPIVKQTLV